MVCSCRLESNLTYYNYKSHVGSEHKQDAPKLNFLAFCVLRCRKYIFYNLRPAFSMDQIFRKSVIIKNQNILDQSLPNYQFLRAIFIATFDLMIIHLCLHNRYLVTLSISTYICIHHISLLILTLHYQYNSMRIN